MNSKEIKAALKAVKEALDQKDYKTAIKQCKNILKVDRNNYLALVFYGAAVQETEQKDEAPKAFKKAIDISPDHILAWRGLLAFFEKNEDNTDSKDILKICVRLLILETDLNKIPEILEKFEKLAISEVELSDIKMICDSFSNDGSQKEILVKNCLVTVLGLKLNLCEDLVLYYQKFLKDLILLSPPLKNHLDLTNKYLKMLYEQKQYFEVITEANKALKHHPEEIFLLEWICKVYCEDSSEGSPQKLIDFSPKDAYSKLLSISPNSYLGSLCKGVYELQNNDFLNACESFKEAIKINSNVGYTWLELCKCQALLYRFPEAEYSCIEALKNFANSEKNQAQILIGKKKLLLSLCEQDEINKVLEAEQLGIQLLESHPSDSEILKLVIKVLIKLEKYFEAEKNLNALGDSNTNVDMKFLRCMILKKKKKNADYKEELKKLIEQEPNYSDAWLELGKLYYYESDVVSCLSCLLKSAKLNQWCFWNFLYLGHCYRTMVKDLEKARRCYQKAFQLNPMNSEVAINLSDMYRILGKEELNLQLLTTITTDNPRLKWAWLKLGLHHISVNQQQDAVNCLRVAVRLDPFNKDAWECLGDAYFAQHAYSSAIKSYEKVIELDSNLIHPRLQIALTKHLTGLFHESVQDFRMINKNTPDYIPALKGHAEACLSLMRNYLSQNLIGLALDACQESVDSLIQCLQLRKNLICIWKLLGDACTLLSNLPEKYCQLRISCLLAISSETEERSGQTIFNKADVLKLGARSFCQAIAINPDFFSLWYNLAFIYNQMVQIRKTNDSKKQMRNLACSAVKKSISLNENSWESWNLYGIILASNEIQNYRLAQHCFIKAIKLHDSDAIIWTNLGTLYLVLDDLQIANQSFTEAQKCDHDYVLCWVGQAIIARITGHHDAMDLFRHSTQLGFSTEGYLGYSDLVCQTVLNVRNKNDKNYIYSVKNMNAITVACDALTWYTERITNNPWAFNMLGLLLERQMLYKRAAEAYGQALEIVRSEKVTEKEDYWNVIDMVLLNYSRVLSNLKKYDDAIAHLKQIKKATFTNQCEVAATFYKAKMYEEAYTSYETTLEWLATDSELKSHILVAMAAVVYLHQGQEDAKILLMQSSQLKPPSVQGLFALCALGILHSDLALSELALKELNNYKEDMKYLGHIAVFQAYIYLFKGQKEKAIRALNAVIHKHPDQPSLWLSLTLLLLNLYPSFDSRIAARCAEVALNSGRSSIDVSKVMSLVSLSNLLSGEGLKSLKSSQKAVHMFPDVTENWVVLVASVLSKCLVQESMEDIFWLKKMVKYVRKRFESSKSMTQWLSNNDRKITMLAEKSAS